MLISDKKKFVFYHIPKNAGVAISVALGEYGNRGNAYLHVGINDYMADPSYYTFAFVRNPWARMVSMYEFCRNRYLDGEDRYTGYEGLMKDFPTWLTETEMWDGSWKDDVIPPIQKRSQSFYLTEDGENVALDFVGKMEDIDEDMKKVCDKLHLGDIKIVPKNQTHKPPYHKYYNEKSRAHVAKYFKWEIDKYGYTF